MSPREKRARQAQPRQQSSHQRGRENARSLRGGLGGKQRPRFANDWQRSSSLSLTSNDEMKKLESKIDQYQCGRGSLLIERTFSLHLCLDSEGLGLGTLEQRINVLGSGDLLDHKRSALAHGQEDVPVNVVKVIARRVVALVERNVGIASISLPLGNALDLQTRRTTTSRAGQTIKAGHGMERDLKPMRPISYLLSAREQTAGRDSLLDEWSIVRASGEGSRLKGLVERLEVVLVEILENARGGADVRVDSVPAVIHTLKAEKKKKKGKDGSLGHGIAEFEHEEFGLTTEAVGRANHIIIC
jgi:hypothetical protein